MQLFAETAEAIASTTKKSEKVRILADYFRRRTQQEAALSAVFFSGRPFPAWDETTLQAGGALLVRVILEVAGRPEPALENAYRKTGDLGAAACELFAAERPVQPPPSRPLTLGDVEQAFRNIAAARGPAAKALVLRRLLERATPLEAKYLVKIVTSELRIGLKESLVEEAIAFAYGDPVAAVQRANMLLGDIGATLCLAAEHALATARMRMFHPLGFMLASPVETAPEAFEFFTHAQVEDKYDGIRAQAHAAHGEVRLFSRTLDDITGSFPELIEPLSAFDGVILDGEILAWDFARGHALPFSELQKRLGRKKVTPAMMRDIPVAYIVFDVLYAEGELIIDQPLRERDAILESIFESANTAHRGYVPTPNPQCQLAFEPAVLAGDVVPHISPGLGDDGQNNSQATAVIRALVLRVDSPETLEELFTRAQARGNEGLMIKDLESRYTPGCRGRSWLKLKREIATLDVVVTSVEWGHGKRINVLSDYTFAVRGPGGELLNVGKAYSGLTDREIADMTNWFMEHTVTDHGYWREVEPNIVLEVAFNAVMRSDRHNSGYALRFPRILRLRRDKPPEEIDALDRVREIYERQQLPKIA